MGEGIGKGGGGGRERKEECLDQGFYHDRISWAPTLANDGLSFNFN